MNLDINLSDLLYVLYIIIFVAPTVIIGSHITKRSPLKQLYVALIVLVKSRSCNLLERDLLLAYIRSYYAWSILCWSSKKRAPLLNLPTDNLSSIYAELLGSFQSKMNDLIQLDTVPSKMSIIWGFCELNLIMIKSTNN